MEQRLSKDKGEGLVQKPVIFILDIDRVLFNTERLYESGLEEFSSYMEDEGALEKLKALGRLCVFSEVTINGTFELQITKLDKLGIRTFFAEEDLHISENKIAQLSKIFEKYKEGIVFLVDDRIDVLEEAKKVNPDVITVWVQRGVHAIKAMSEPRDFRPDAAAIDLNVFAIMAPGMITQRRREKVTAR